MNVLMMADFLAECSGNFVNSLLELADYCKKKGDSVCFLFPLKPDGSETDWMSYIRRSGYPAYTYDKEKTNEKEFLTELIQT